MKRKVKTPLIRVHTYFVGGRIYFEANDLASTIEIFSAILAAKAADRTWFEVEMVKMTAAHDQSYRYQNFTLGSIRLTEGPISKIRLYVNDALPRMEGMVSYRIIGGTQG